MKTYPLSDRALCLNCGRGYPVPVATPCECGNSLIISIWAVRKERS